MSEPKPLANQEESIYISDVLISTRDRERLATEWDSFDQRARRARAPVFYAGGNRDLTNPVMWDVYEERYGKRYYHFLYRDTLFLVLDTEDNTPEQQWALHEIRDEAMKRVEAEGWSVFMDTAYGRAPERKYGHVGAAQAAYFRDVIERYGDVRHTFVVLHKPVWEAEGDAVVDGSGLQVVQAGAGFDVQFQALRIGN